MLRSTGFFIGAWAFHYFPFYLMNRQLFLHHYLPAHLASALVAGSVLNFILIETVNYPISAPGITTRLRPRIRARLSPGGLVSVAVLLVAVVWTFWFISPLTYGNPACVIDGHMCTLDSSR
jgi:dolichyl-phosphate-mannose-protein mannosyltransferase